MKAFDLVSRKGLFTLLPRIGCLPKNLRIRLEKACRAPSNRMAHPQTHFQLRVEWRRDVYLSQHSSASSSPYCCPMLSASQRMVYTSTWEAIEVSLTLHGYGRRLRCSRYSTRSCFLQMKLLSLPTPQKPSRDSSTALHMVQWLWPNNQSQEDQHQWPRWQYHSKHHHWWLQLEVVEEFTYLSSTVSSNLFLDIKLNKRICKAAAAAAAMARLAKRVWNNIMLTINTKMKVNQVCFMAAKHGPSTPTRSTDPMHFIYAASGLLDITWQDHVPNKIAKRACTSMHKRASQTCLHFSLIGACADSATWVVWKIESQDWNRLLTVLKPLFPLH